MRFKGWIKALATATVLAAPAAHAGIYIDPYIGFTTGKWERGANDGKYDGVSYGARLGYSVLGFAIGAEYQTGKLTDDSNPKFDLTPNIFGVFIGYTFPILVRAYATYFVKSDLELKNSSSKTTYKGNGMKLGVGFTGLPFVAINLEMLTASYDEFESGALSGSLNPKLETSAYMLSVSLPLDF